MVDTDKTDTHPCICGPASACTRRCSRVGRLRTRCRSLPHRPLAVTRMMASCGKRGAPRQLAGTRHPWHRHSSQHRDRLEVSPPARTFGSVTSGMGTSPTVTLREPIHCTAAILLSSSLRAVVVAAAAWSFFGSRAPSMEAMAALCEVPATQMLQTGPHGGQRLPSKEVLAAQRAARQRLPSFALPSAACLDHDWDSLDRLLDRRRQSSRPKSKAGQKRLALPQP